MNSNKQYILPLRQNKLQEIHLAKKIFALPVLVLSLLHTGYVDAAPSKPFNETHTGIEAGTQQVFVKGNYYNYQIVDGLVVYQGDMIIGTEEDLNRNPTSVFSVITDKHCTVDIGPIEIGCVRRWKERTIKYIISSKFSSTKKSQIRNALKHWQDRSVFSFEEDPTIRGKNASYLLFKKIDSGCSATIGKVGAGQSVNLSDGCGFGTIIHEVGHSLGLFHGQSRCDRDGYITVNEGNLTEVGKAQFKKQCKNASDIGSYNLGSIMHYPRFLGKRFVNDTSMAAFTVNSNRQPLGVTVGQRDGLSSGDIDAISAVYSKPRSARIVSSYNANKCFKKKESGWTNGNPIHLWDCDTGKNASKSWDYEPSTGYIRNVYNPEKCLHKKDGGWANGNSVHLWDCDAGSNSFKSWDYEPSSGYVRSRSNPNMCLHKKDGGWANGNRIHLWRCNEGQNSFKSWNIRMLITPKNNVSKCLHKKSPGWSNGNQIHLWDCDAGIPEFRSWKYEPSTGYIRNLYKPSMCLHKKDGSWANGNPVHLWRCNEGPASHKTWDYDALSGQISARGNSAMCLHKKNGGWDNGNSVHLWSCNAGISDFKSWNLKY